MSKQNILVSVTIVSFAGILFSGYLSYYELFAGGCSETIVNCGVKAVSIASLPVCIYGLFMYTAIFTLSCIGLQSRGSE